MKKKFFLGVVLSVMLFLTGCTGAQVRVDPETNQAVYDGKVKLSSLKSQAWYDGIEVVNGDVSIGYLLGTDSYVGMANLKEINGNLILDKQVLLEEISFPKLEKVAGNVIVSGKRFSCVLKKLNLYNLKEVGGDFEYVGIRTNKYKGIEALNVPHLKKIGGSLRIEDTDKLKGILMTNLNSVGGDIEVLGNERLVYLDMASLKNLGGEAYISNNKILVHVRINSLKDASYVSLTDNAYELNHSFEVELSKELKNVEIDGTLLSLKNRWEDVLKKVALLFLIIIFNSEFALANDTSDLKRIYRKEYLNFYNKVVGNIEQNSRNGIVAYNNQEVEIFYKEMVEEIKKKVKDKGINLRYIRTTTETGIS